MATINSFDLTNIKNKVREMVGGRGDGTLLFEKRPSGKVEAYYLYLFNGKEAKIKIGPYKATRAGHGYTLAESRDKAQELSRLYRECGGDLKGYLKSQEAEREQKQREEQQQLEMEARKGSFAELIESYVKDQEKQGRETAHQTKQAFNRNVIKAYPEIAAKKAKDVTPDDIVTILAAIHNRGSAGESVRVRSLLSACFNFGIQGDYDPTRVTDKRFYIQYNPVAATKRNKQAMKVGDRVLSHSEVKNLWEDVGDTHRVGFVMACFIQFMLATGGQRPKQLLQARWEDYDFSRNCVTLVDKKGKAGTIKVHVVPLSKRALDILEAVKSVSENYPWPFCSGATGRKESNKGQLLPLTLGSLKKAFARYNEYLAEKAKAEGKPDHKTFTARDIRRSVKNILIDAGVNREQRNLLQSHAQTGVDIKHYDRHEHLPEKRGSIRRYDALLGKILNGEETKLVDMEEYRQRFPSNQ